MQDTVQQKEDYYFYVKLLVLLYNYLYNIESFIRIEYKRNVKNFMKMYI